MAKGLFRKFRGVDDKAIAGSMAMQAMMARVVNHNARILIKLVVLALVEAAAVIYLLLRGL